MRRAISTPCRGLAVTVCGELEVVTMTTAKKSTTARAKKTTDAIEAEEPNFLRLDDQLCFPIYLAARLVVNGYRPLLEDLGVTYPQYLVLLVLWENDSLNVSTLGARLHLDSGTLTPLLKRMEKQGLITRHRRGDDDRVVENQLTEAGRALKQDASQIPVQMMCNAQLELHDVQRIRQVMDDLIQKLMPLQ
jgi:DNA-binding MarR family transcriptional regulator